MFLETSKFCLHIISCHEQCLASRSINFITQVPLYIQCFVCMPHQSSKCGFDHGSFHKASGSETIVAIKYITCGKMLL